ncbi:MAG: cupin domain-containing protein [Pseudomonadota bacterium]
MNKPVNEPWWAVVPPEKGESWWQPLPSRGHVTLKLTNENSPYDTFTSGIQVLPPGCYVREHGHRGNHELIFIHEGSGEVQIEGNTYPLEKGATVMFGRYARHIITNTGDVDMKMFWVFMPPGLEHWFRAIGRPREAGEDMPEAFDRPDDVAQVMEQLRFVPPGGDS